MIFRHIATQRVLGFGVGPAVIFDAENAARLERGKKRAEHLCGVLLVFGGQPVVHIAEGHHQVGRAGRRNSQLARRPQRRELHVAEHLGILLDLVLECRNFLALIAEGRSGAVLRFIQLALALQYGREHFRVPAATGPDLDDRHVPAQAKEGQRFLGMAKAIPRLVAITAMGPRQRGIERVTGGRVGLRHGVD